MKTRNYTPKNITSLKENEVFVFGSNLDGNHGGGAAWAAYKKFGAIMGQGVGLQGQSYAIPTMQGGVETIKPYVDEFIQYAKKHPNLTFYVTRIGCGIAGFKDEEMAPLFRMALGIDNIILPKTFVDCLGDTPPFDVDEFNNIINWILPGLQLFYRDTNVPVEMLDEIAEAYKQRGIIRAGFFIDCTSRAAKPVKSLRFIIASAHAAALWETSDDVKVKEWRLNVLDYNAYFKVMDAYRVGEQLQILLLHIPLRGLSLISSFGNFAFDGDFDLVKIARESFDQKKKMEALPWLESEEWNVRTEDLPGTTEGGWAEIAPLLVPHNKNIAHLHNLVLCLAHDNTDLNKPFEKNI